MDGVVKEFFFGIFLEFFFRFRGFEVVKK